MEIEIAVAVLILFALIFLATVDMAFTQLSDVSLRRLTAESEEKPASHSVIFLRQILEKRPRFRFALSATIQILLIIFSVLVTLIVYNFYSENPIELLIVSLLVGLTFSGLFRQIIPRLITWRNPETKLLFLLPFVRPLYSFMSFLADPLERFLKSKEQQKLETTIMPSAAEEDEDNAEHLEAFIKVGEAEGIVKEKDREMLETMFEFSETRAGEIMTPRTEICALPIDATIRAARDLIIEEKYSRLPVYRDSVDNIEGVIYVRDLLNAWAEDRENQTIETLLRPAFFVPETKSASELLKNMQKSHIQLAIVIDEYGGVAGVISVEDIVEEIVGEIEDEDTAQEEVIEIIEGENKSYFDVLGSTEIGKIERIFDMEIEDDDFTTIAGLVTSEAGYVPKRGEKLSIRGLDIEILKADEKKLNLLRLRKSDSEDLENTHEVSAAS